MKREKTVKERLELVRGLMDKRGLPRGVAERPRPRSPLKGVRVKEQVYPPGYRHGEILLEDLHRFPGRIFRYLGGGDSFESFLPEKAVFLDTETTGLAGGAGTYAFLVGTGYFDPRGFVVKQYLMPDLSEEKEMLTLLGEDLKAFPSIVTFNGRAFDLPLLQTRYVMQGMRPPWSWEHHLDLLPVSRRFWHGRFEDCRLASLEEGVLNFRREGDIPGHAIPSLYVRFLKERRLRLLEPVLSHNSWDIASLAALAVSACRMLEKGEDLDLDEGRDLAAAGGAFGAAEDSELSLRCLREALKHELPEERRLAVFRALGHTLKSLDRREEARALWEEARTEFPDDDLCRLELAMHYEHRLRDFDGALDAAREALGILRRKCRVAAANPPLTRERGCELRVERLKRKIALRKGGGKGS